MRPAIVGFYLVTLERVLLRLERAAYLSPELHRTGSHLTQARGEIQAARHDLPARRAAAQRGRAR